MSASRLISDPCPVEKISELYLPGTDDTELVCNSCSWSRMITDPNLVDLIKGRHSMANQIHEKVEEEDS